jgi:predicted SprT family Zn-dependent metalloprotease
MTDDLVERVAGSLWRLQYHTPYETDANSSARIEFRAIAKEIITLASNQALEEAAKKVEEVLFYHSCCCSFEAAAAIRARIETNEK